MPSMVHAPYITPGFFKDKTSDHIPSAFTAVNGRNSPPSPPRLSGINGLTMSTNHQRPISRHSPERPQDSTSRETPRDRWSPPQPAPDPVHRNGYQNGHLNSHQNGHQNGQQNGHQNGHQSGHQNGHQNSHQNGNSLNSPPFSDRDRSPPSPIKRKRSASAEVHSPDSPDTIPAQRRRLDTYAPTRRSNSPNTIAQVQQLAMDHSQPRTLPPVDRMEIDRPWAASHESVYSGLPREAYHETSPQHRDLLRTTESDSTHDAPSQALLNVADRPDEFKPSSTTRTTAAGVQVDPKKRKRQFANRTKTGCGTCRRRKKKCDEGKPECNNCQRGGFICEGYANKVPWPKNGTPKPNPPLVSKDRFPVDPAQLYHSHGAPRESFTESVSSNGTDGGRARPIVVEEHDRPPARDWTNGWGDRTAYSQEQQHTEYAHAPSNPGYGRPPSDEQRVAHSTPAPPPARQHTARQYHYTQETMADKLNKSTPAITEAHPSQQSIMAPHTTGPPGPPPSHYAPPPSRHEKSEKAKMMNEEPFYPFDRELVAEREKCRRAVYAFNNTCNNNLTISDGEIDRNLRNILSANWNQTLRGGGPTGHLGKAVSIDTPFTCHYGYNLHIGSHVEIGTGCKFLDSGDITIGDGCTIGANVTINTVKTPTDPRSAKGTGPHRTSVALKVHIGKNVWIGTDCIIKAGVSIGENAIIDDGSVVGRDVPANTILQNHS